MIARRVRPSRRLFAKSAFAATSFAVFGTPLKGLAESVLRFSIGTPATDSITQQLISFARTAQSRSRGAVRIEVYPSSQLAKEPDVIPGMQTGLLDGALLTSAFMDPVFKRLQALSLPFIFPSHASMWRVLDGDVGRILNVDMAEKGVTTLAWGSYSVRQFEFREKPVTKPTDMRGMRIRVINSSLFISMIKALGSIPVPIDSAETYLALAQKTVDGLDYPLPQLLSTKISQVVKYVSLTEHGMNSAALIISKRRLESLPPDQQKSIHDAAREILPAWRKSADTANDTAAQDCQKQGLTVDKVDKPAFRRSMEPVYDEYRSSLGADFIDKIIKAAV